MQKIRNILYLFGLMAFIVINPAYSEKVEYPANSINKKAPITNDLCTITGTVVNIQKKTDNPWPDTPNIFTSEFKEVTVKINSSKALSKVKTEENRCKRIKQGQVKRYRVCSKAYLRRGDDIKGNESSSLGLSRHVTHCLFDIKVKRKKRTNQ